MKKTLNIIETALQSAVLTLIVLGIMMATSSCSTERGIRIHKKGSSYSKKKVYRVSKKPHGRCVGGTCYAF